jgi:hypothetical protein
MQEEEEHINHLGAEIILGFGRVEIRMVVPTPRPPYRRCCVHFVGGWEYVSWFSVRLETAQPSGVTLVADQSC